MHRLSPPDFQRLERATQLNITVGGSELTGMPSLSCQRHHARPERRTAATTAEAISTAKAAGAIVSYDLSYRAKLWTREKARQVQTPFMANVDILITTEEDVERVFDITGKDYREVARVLAERFHLKAVAITLRGTPSVWKNTWSAPAYAEGKF